MEEKTYTQQELADILERQQLVFSLDHAIQRAKQAGDSPQFVNPLINLYNVITAPAPAPVIQKPEEQPE